MSGGSATGDSGLGVASGQQACPNVWVSSIQAGFSL
jgi:hypothetical protein